MPEEPQQQQMTPEQQEELRKKLESMSPEELREFQKKQCIFCHIVAGKVAAKKIYEDDKTIAVLDINPGNPGHVLLMPKEHYMIMPQLPEDELQHIFTVAKHLSNVLLRTLDVRGTNIIVANGPAAGQRAQHFMIHIIPRKEGDGLEFNVPSNKYSEEELDKVAATVTKRLNELLGVKEEDKQQTSQEILEKPKKKVVEADFKEDDSEEDNEPEDNEDDEPEEDDDKDEEDNNDDNDEGDDNDKGDGADLDAIARVLNG
jgi:histidine triad (HIT) family protein